jgi:hypothetical protein
MKRRHAISAVGLSFLPLSGCLENLGGGATGGDPASEEGRSVSITVTHVAGNRAISFGHDVRRATITEESPAVVELTARNETERDVEYGTGAPRPFGALYDPDSPGAILWTERYAESQYVDTEGRRITGGEDIGLEVTLSPGGSRSETYEFSAPPGSYSIRRTGNPITLGEDTYELEATVSEA